MHNFVNKCKKIFLISQPAYLISNGQNIHTKYCSSYTSMYRDLILFFYTQINRIAFSFSKPRKKILRNIANTTHMHEKIHGGMAHVGDVTTSTKKDLKFLKYSRCETVMRIYEGAGKVRRRSERLSRSTCARRSYRPAEEGHTSLSLTHTLTRSHSLCLTYIFPLMS